MTDKSVYIAGLDDEVQVVDYIGFTVIAFLRFDMVSIGVHLPLYDIGDSITPVFHCVKLCFKSRCFFRKTL